MPYECRFCGGTYCASHRLPENHGCAGLDAYEADMQARGKIYDDRATTPVGSRGLLDRIRRAIPLSSFRGNVTFAFLALMWVTFLLQNLTQFALPNTLDGHLLYRAIFTLQPQHPEYVWTWFTSIFAHGGFFHIVANSIVIYFFGQLVERYIGSRNFAILFLASGAAAGLGQIGIPILMGEVEPVRIVGNTIVGTPPVVGASGAGLAIMGVLTVLNPNLTVMLLFPPVPLPLWIITFFYAAMSAFGMLGGMGGGIAHTAHLVGLAIGLAYGRYLQKQGIRPPGRMQIGGGGPGGGGRRGPPRI